jgi:DNA-binding XRE family transcriptional regulator
VIRELTSEQPSLLPRDEVDIDDLLAELETTPHGANTIADGRKWVAENFYSDSASLAALRLQRGWSQAELARRVGTSQSYIGRLEKHTIDPQLSTVRKIAHALGMPVAAVDEALTTEKTS